MQNKIEHSQRAHALLSASASHRWLNCTPSARLEDEERSDGSSVFAQEGTFAHELAEIKLREYLGAGELATKVALHDLASEIEKYNLVSKTEFTLEAMESPVDEYVSRVIEDFEDARRIDPTAKLLVEVPFDLSSLFGDFIWSEEKLQAASFQEKVIYAVEIGIFSSEMLIGIADMEEDELTKLIISYVKSLLFGTNDAIIIADGTARVRDLKFGRGIAVESKENPQLMLYSYGAMESFNGLYSIDKVVLHIDQPRLDNFSAWEISVDDLYEWAHGFVRDRAKLALKGEGEFCAGSWCQFCKVRGRCRHLADVNLSLAKHEFAEPALLTDEEVGEVLAKLPKLEDWASAVKKYAYDEAVNSDKQWPGFKLVESRSNRRWLSDNQVADTLSMEGFTDEQIYNKKLKGIGDVEKLIGKKSFDPLLGSLVIKPEGSPSLVPDTDKRPALTRGSALERAQTEFTD